MSKYDSIKTATELVAEVRANGLSRDIEDLNIAQEILDRSSTDELVRLANNLGPNGEPLEVPTGTETNTRRPTQKTFYHIAFTVWKWEDAVEFFNRHTNPEHAAYIVVLEENKRLRKAKTELEDLRDTLLHEQEMAASERKELQDQVQTLLCNVEEDDYEIMRLKAELYDYMKEID